jgi:hypothetical protein
MKSFKNNKLKRAIGYALPFAALLSSPVLARNSPSEVEAGTGAPRSENEMLLICDGSTFTVAPTSQTNAFVADNRGNMVTGSATSTAPANVGFQVQLRIIGNDAEMHLPAAAAPRISAKNGGWRKVKELQITENQISGKVRTDWFDSSSFRIDRRTGSITSEGGFSGTCRKQDLQQRAF